VIISVFGEGQGSPWWVVEVQIGASLVEDCFLEGRRILKTLQKVFLARVPLAVFILFI
jgi:hypothetical protein